MREALLTRENSSGSETRHARTFDGKKSRRVHDERVDF
jgi:hypothetical protein